MGEFTSALHHLNLGRSLYDPQKHYAHALMYGQDPGVICLSRASYVIWFLGYPDQALRSIRQALTLAQELSHPFSLAGALHFTAMLHHLYREAQATQERVEELIALSREQGFTQWLALGVLMRGWALAAQGQGETGIAQIRQGLAAYAAVGAKLGQPYLLAVLAEAYGKAGQPAEGLNVLAEALTVAQNTGDCFFEAELHRLKGQLTLQSQTSPRQVQDKSKTSQDKSESRKSESPKAEINIPQSTIRNPQSEAEACLLKAIEIARRQQAKSLELRATVSLARLWQRQGKQHKAHQVLFTIYSWFTEGLGTADLREAQTLLEELSQ